MNWYQRMFYGIPSQRGAVDLTVILIVLAIIAILVWLLVNFKVVEK